ncbi:alpha/beta hydrolase fold domain-containing protein [Chloroflexota bacterium]
MRHSGIPRWGFFRTVVAVVAVLCLIIIAVNAGAQSNQNKVERDVVYGIAGDNVLLMDIYYPLPIEANRAAVLYIHGGGWYSGDKASDIGRAFIPTLVSRGYLVAAINYRLAPRFCFPAQIGDARNALHFLVAEAGEYGIDPQRIGVWGDSAGGHLASLLGTIDGNTGREPNVRAVINMYGPSDLTAYYQNDNSPHIEHVFGVTDADSEVIIQASPITHASPSSPPFLLIHGEDDTVVSYEQSQAFYNSLDSMRVNVELIKVLNCEHCFKPTGNTIYPDREMIGGMMADFLDKHLTD